MIVDSSAVIAVLDAEPEFERLRDAFYAAPAVSISAATLVECGLVAGPRRGARLDLLLEWVGADVVPFDAEQARIAREAHVRYGRGSGSPARLNFGDCFSYALAQVTGEPLLFKGDDFAHTDVRPAL